MIFVGFGGYSIINETTTTTTQTTGEIGLVTSHIIQTAQDEIDLVASHCVNYVNKIFKAASKQGRNNRVRSNHLHQMLNYDYKLQHGQQSIIDFNKHSRYIVDVLNHEIPTIGHMTKRDKTISFYSNIKPQDSNMNYFQQKMDEFGNVYYFDKQVLLMEDIHRAGLKLKLEMIQLEKETKGKEELLQNILNGKNKQIKHLIDKNLFSIENIKALETENKDLKRETESLKENVIELKESERKSKDKIKELQDKIINLESKMGTVINRYSDLFKQFRETSLTNTLGLAYQACLAAAGSIGKSMLKVDEQYYSFLDYDQLVKCNFDTLVSEAAEYKIGNKNPFTNKENGCAGLKSEKLIRYCIYIHGDTIKHQKCSDVGKYIPSERNYYSCKGDGVVNETYSNGRCNGCQKMYRAVIKLSKDFVVDTVLDKNIIELFIESNGTMFQSQYDIVNILQDLMKSHPHWLKSANGQIVLDQITNSLKLLDGGNAGELRYNNVSYELAESIYYHGGKSLMDIIRGYCFHIKNGEVQIDPSKSNLMFPSITSLVERSRKVILYEKLEETIPLLNIVLSKFPFDQDIVLSTNSTNSPNQSDAGVDSIPQSPIPPLNSIAPRLIISYNSNCIDDSPLPSLVSNVSTTTASATKTKSAILVFDEMDIVYKLGFINGLIYGLNDGYITGDSLGKYKQLVDEYKSKYPSTWKSELKKLMATKILQVFIVSLDGSFSFPVISIPTYKETSESIHKTITDMIAFFSKHYNINIVGGSSDSFDIKCLLNTIPGFYHVFDYVHSGKAARNALLGKIFEIIGSNGETIKFSGRDLFELYNNDNEFESVAAASTICPTDKMSLDTLIKLLKQDVINYLIKKACPIPSNYIAIGTDGSLTSIPSISISTGACSSLIIGTDSFLISFGSSISIEGGTTIQIGSSGATIPIDSTVIIGTGGANIQNGTGLDVTPISTGSIIKFGECGTSIQIGLDVTPISTGSIIQFRAQGNRSSIPFANGVGSLPTPAIDSVDNTFRLSTPNINSVGTLSTPFVNGPTDSTTSTQHDDPMIVDSIRNGGVSTDAGSSNRDRTTSPFSSKKKKDIRIKGTFPNVKQATVQDKWYEDGGFAKDMLSKNLNYSFSDYKSGKTVSTYAPVQHLNEKYYQLALFIVSIKVLFQAFEAELTVDERLYYLKLVGIYFNSFSVNGLSDCFIKHLAITTQSLIQLVKLHTVAYGYPPTSFTHFGSNLAENFFSIIRSKTSRPDLLSYIATMHKAIVEMMKRYMDPNSDIIHVNYKPKEFTGSQKCYGRFSGIFNDQDIKSYYELCKLSRKRDDTSANDKTVDVDAAASANGPTSTNASGIPVSSVLKRDDLWVIDIINQFPNGNAKLSIRQATCKTNPLTETKDIGRRTEKIMICPSKTCNKYYSYAAALDRHYREKHGSECQYTDRGSTESFVKQVENLNLIKNDGILNQFKQNNKVAILVFDMETSNRELIEVTHYNLLDGSAFYSLIKPPTQEIGESNLHKIYQDQLCDSPSFEIYENELIKICKQYEKVYLFSHSTHSMDMNVLIKQLPHIDQINNLYCVDTIPIFKKFIGSQTKSKQMSKLISHFELEKDGLLLHSTNTDVFYLLALLEKCNVNKDQSLFTFIYNLILNNDKDKTFGTFHNIYEKQITSTTTSTTSTTVKKLKSNTGVATITVIDQDVYTYELFCTCNNKCGSKKCVCKLNGKNCNPKCHPNKNCKNI